jgi:tetratricopeptide (TPR) repeat protein
MAKHCEVCKQSYADELPSCPHCAEALEVTVAEEHQPSAESMVVVELDDASKSQAKKAPGGSDSAIILGKSPGQAPTPGAMQGSESDLDIGLPAARKGGPTMVRGSESEIDIGLPPSQPPTGADSGVVLGAEQPPSGTSTVEWVTLVEDVTPPLESGVRIDSPSDVDLLKQAATSPDSSSDVGTGKSASAAPADETSAVDLGKLARGQAQTPSDLHLVHEAMESSTSGVKLDDVDKGGSAEAVVELAEEPGPSSVHLGDKPGDAGAGSASGLDLAILSEHEGGSSELVAEEAEEEETPATGEPSGESLLAELDEHEAGSTIKSSRPPASDKAPAPQPGATTLRQPARETMLGSEEPDYDAAEAEDEESSAVDLGAPPVVTDREADEAGEEATEAADEEAVAADEAEAEQAEDEEEAPAPKRVAAAPAGAKAWPKVLAGSALGLIVGAGAMFGAHSFLGLGEKKLEQTQQVRGDKQQPTMDDAKGLLSGGDPEKALPILNSQGDSPEVLAMRGEAMWLLILQKQAPTAPIKADDQLVQQAAETLKKAGDNADALFWLGNLHEVTGNLKAARETYQKGVNLPDPLQKKRFQAALDRLDVQAALTRSGEHAAIPERIEALVLLLTVLQQPGQKPGDGAGQDDEAGFEFWKAVKLAYSAEPKDQKEALEKLKKARDLHDKQRFKRLRKAQNPLSDPTEAIFLKCCDELEAYWKIPGYLRSRGYLVKGGKAEDAVKDVLAKSDALHDVARMLGQGKFETKDVAPAVQKLVEAKKDAEDKLKTSDGLLKAAEDKLKNAGARLTAAGIKEADLAKGVDQLAAANKAAEKKAADLDGDLKSAKKAIDDAKKEAAANLKTANTAQSALDDVVKSLKTAKYLAADAGRADALKGVDKAIEMAKTVDPAGKLAAAELEVKRQQGLLAQRKSPQQMLDFWRNVLRDNPYPQWAEAALLDAKRTEADKKSTAEELAKASAVAGMAYRNQHKFPEARAALQKALKDAPDKIDWRATPRAVLRELTDPAAFYLPRAQQLYDARAYFLAIFYLDEGLQAFPDDKGRLLAARSLAHLAEAKMKAKGKLKADLPDVVAARKDAQDAIAAGAKAEGHYASGRLAEALGDLAAARKSYEQALEAHPAEDLDGKRYRIALAQVLLRMNEDKEAPADKGRGVGKRPSKPSRVLSLFTPAGEPDPLAAVVLLLALADGDEDGGPQSPEEQKARALAEQILKARPVRGDFVIRSQAYALQGLWNQALRTYVDGLLPLIPQDYADGLAELVNNHPAFKRPDSLNVPNTLEAERFYANGLREFSARRYVQAEEQFLAAVKNDDQDARYFFYLGLSRWAQNKRDKQAEARLDFERGARLEKQNKPGTVVINEALERVQGKARQEMAKYRK